MSGKEEVLLLLLLAILSFCYESPWRQVLLVSLDGLMETKGWNCRRASLVAEGRSGRTRSMLEKLY